MKHWIQLVSLIGVLSISCANAALPKLDESLQSARAWTEADNLTVSTGSVTREFTWTGKGLVTTGLSDLRTGRQWGDRELTAEDADWRFPELIRGKAELLSLSAKPSTDEGFTSQHLEVVAEMEYPESGVTLKFVVWVYPGAPGIRTQVWLKGEPGSGPSEGGDGELPTLSVVSGKSHRIPESAGETSVGRDHDLTNLFGSKMLELKLEGLKTDREYQVMASWWDTGRLARRIQMIEALSMDGETVEKVVEPVTLPSWRDKKMPSTVSFEIPDSVRVGQTVRLRVSKVSGVNANVSELWVYERGDAASSPIQLQGDPARLKKLEKLAPEGHYLAAYLDCGNTAGSHAVAGGASSGRRVDFLPVKDGELTAFGYYNDTQNRHNSEDHMSRQESVSGSDVDWASVLFIESPKGGIAWVKESHKCVNRSGVDTGSFARNAAGLHNSGSGLSAKYLMPDSYRWCWATWTVLYPEATADQRELAMKQFDRARFPVDPSRDVWIKANTWGSGNSGRESMSRAEENEVLKEIDSVADLGIDVLQIDDGWQKGRSKEPDAKKNEWRTRDGWYPNGWKTVREVASRKGVRLGLWTAARVELEDLKHNYDEGGFETWKYDFAHISNYEHLHEHWSKLRAFLTYTGHKARMAVDVTENAPRFGYFWARDFGCVWLSNRKPQNPPNTIPQPTLMLRENRELAEYVNLNKFELPIQNFARVNQDKSDAHLYGHGYEVALGLMGIPTFFQSTYHYEGEARDEVRSLLTAFKPVQQELYQRYVFIIGDDPNGEAWSGFQWVDPASDRGYLLVFRERENGQAARNMGLRFAKAGDQLILEDLCTDKSTEVVVGSDGSIPLMIKNPAGFVFLRYDVKGGK
ncbi:hypothetical protein [Haloferula sp.]|uniref:hypothetical protein n=1 Tax=Haloferula sp. TaxID=2497595 RepID=UPI00329E1853